MGSEFSGPPEISMESIGSFARRTDLRLGRTGEGVPPGEAEDDEDDEGGKSGRRRLFSVVSLPSLSSLVLKRSDLAL